MTAIGATYCKSGVLLFADSKRTDLLVDTTLPDTVKLTRIVPWGSLATAGAGSLGDAARLFLRSILFTHPPSAEDVLSEIGDAMRHMYGRYVARTGSDQPTAAVFGGVPPRGNAGIWTFSSKTDFAPTPLDPETTFWVAASDTPAAKSALGGFWNPGVRSNRDSAAGCALQGVMALAAQDPRIGPPIQMTLHLASGEYLVSKIG